MLMVKASLHPCAVTSAPMMVACCELGLGYQTRRFATEANLRGAQLQPARKEIERASGETENHEGKKTTSLLAKGFEVKWLW